MTKRNIRGLSWGAMTYMYRQRLRTGMCSGGGWRSWAADSGPWTRSSRGNGARSVGFLGGVASALEFVLREAGAVKAGYTIGRVETYRLGGGPHGL